MSFFSKFLQWLPNPMRNLRKHLGIEEQWHQFMHHIQPHKHKIYLAIVIVSYPLYSNYALQLWRYSLSKINIHVNSWLEIDQPPFQITENFAKNLLGSILSDENIKHEGLNFVNSIVQKDQFVSDILNLLVSALKRVKSLQGSSKQLTIQLLDDQQVQKTLKDTLSNVANSSQVKQAFINLIEKAFSSERSLHTTIQLLIKAMQNQEVKQALSGSINYSVQELLKDEEMMSQLKIFIFFLLRKFENDSQIKSMMDVLFAKGLGLTKKKKENELQKLLRNIDQKERKNETEL